MARSRSEGPRSLAYEVLTAVDEKEAFADRALDGRLRRSASLPDRDRRLATELVYGTIRRRGSLDRCLQPSLRRPLERLDPEILRILRLGAYQILFLDRVPDHAAVNESVELANRLGRRGSGSLVNGALRALCRAKAEGKGLPSSDIRAGEADFPAWLTRIWERELGKEKAGEILGALLSPPQTVLRTNTLKTDRTGLIDRLKGEGYEAEPVDGLPQAVRLSEGGDIRKTDCYRQGWCVQQDGASQLIVEILDPRPGERVLDLCAAPGIKTTHMAEKMADQGLVVALDSHLGRLRELAEGCRRMGVTVTVARVRRCVRAPAPSGRAPPFRPRPRGRTLLRSRHPAEEPGEEVAARTGLCYTEQPPGKPDQDRGRAGAARRHPGLQHMHRPPGGERSDRRRIHCRAWGLCPGRSDPLPARRPRGSCLRGRAPLFLGQADLL